MSTLARGWIQPTNRYFFDTEFVEIGASKPIDLISIGIVSENGREYYAISTEYDRAAAEAHSFVAANVLPIIDAAPPEFHKSRHQIALDIISFVGYEPQFWADFAAYDWVSLCGLYGPMVNLPKGWPMYVRDVQQARKMMGMDKLPSLPGATPHHALSDAKEVSYRFNLVQEEAYARYGIRI